MRNVSLQALYKNSATSVTASVTTLRLARTASLALLHPHLRTYTATYTSKMPSSAAASSSSSSTASKTAARPTRSSSRSSTATITTTSIKRSSKQPEASDSAPVTSSISQAQSKRKSTSTTPDSTSASNNAAKATADESNPQGDDSPAAKKPRKSKKDSDPSYASPSAPKGEDHLADPSLPKNTSIPEVLEYAPPNAPNNVRIVSWNITSLKSSEPKGLMRYIQAEDPHILVLTETKVNDVPMHPGLTKIFPHQYWGIGKTKGYAGVAVLSKIKPKKVVHGFPSPLGQELDSKARIITLEFESTYLVATYAVNSGEGLKSMQTKMQWNAALASHIRGLDQIKPVIWCGDLNVVLDSRDLASASKKWNKSPGYTAQECDFHNHFLQGKQDPSSSTQADNDNEEVEAKEEEGEGGEQKQVFVDIWRRLHPDAVGHYTFWGWRGMCRTKGIGWRLDSFILSHRIIPKVNTCEIRYEVYGASDHVPIYCDVQGPL